MAPLRQRLLLHGSLSVVQLLGLALLFSAMPWGYGFPLDDAWIHQVVSENIVFRGELRLHPDFPGSGTSSLGFTYILAFARAVLGTGGVGFVGVLNAVAIVAVGQGLLSLLAFGKDSRLPTDEAWLFAASVALTGNALWFAVCGMEAALLAAVATTLLWVWYGKGPLGMRRCLVVGALSVALILVRPEAGIILPALLFRRPASRRALACFFLPIALAVIALVVLSAHGIVAVPSTLAARRWIYGGPIHDLRAASSLLVLIAWRSFVFGVGSEEPGIAVAFAVLSAVGWLRLFRAAGPGARGLFAAMLLHIAFYAWELPVPGHGGRYQPLAPCLALAPCTVAILSLARAALALVQLDRHIQRGLLGAVAATALFCVLPSALSWRTIAADGIEHIERTEVAMGRLVSSAVPTNAVVASFDIGAITYFAGRPVLDLGGLADPALVPELRAGRVADYMRAHRVRFVVLPEAPRDMPRAWHLPLRLGLVGRRDITLTPLSRLESPLAMWARAATATSMSSPFQVLYAVAYDTDPNGSTPPEPP